MNNYTVDSFKAIMEDHTAARRALVSLQVFLSPFNGKSFNRLSTANQNNIMVKLNDTAKFFQLQGVLSFPCWRDEKCIITLEHIKAKLLSIENAIHAMDILETRLTELHDLQETLNIAATKKREILAQCGRLPVLFIL